MPRRTQALWFIFSCRSPAFKNAQSRSHTSQSGSAVHFDGRVVVAKDEGSANEGLALLMKEKVLGFATIRSPSVRAKTQRTERLNFDSVYGGMTSALMDFPSLLQIVGSNTAVLLRLSMLNKLPSSLCKLIEDGKVLKVGVNVMHDVQLLQRSEFERHGLELWAEGFLDLFSMHTALASSASSPSESATTATTATSAPQQRSVHDLVPLVFGGSKLWDIRLELSDWEASPELTPEQQLYAASLAWTGREILRRRYLQDIRGPRREPLLHYLRQHCTLEEHENLFS